MDNKINGRTPEEIKRRLGCLLSEEDRSCDEHADCFSCSFRNAVYIEERECYELTLTYIRQLERERDAAVRDMYHAASDGGSFCDICKYKGEPCDERKAADIECWQWRGVQEV